MSVIWYPMLAVISAVQISGINIMLNKPSIQSSTWATYTLSSAANDGNRTGNPSLTPAQKNPFWQGDLEGFYTVTSISVTSANNGWSSYLKETIFGVSVHGVGCSENEVTRCGSWPDIDLKEHTIMFNCPHAGPVRFVRIWKEIFGYLSLGEVEVEGEPSRLTGSCGSTSYDKVMQQKVIASTKSLSVTDVMDCSAICYRTQPCFAFSYSPSEQPNCLLSSCVTMSSDMKWDSYKVIDGL